MPIIDFTGSYRDATRGATIKALQERQKTYEQAAMEAAAPQQISSPWQGGAQLMGVLGAKLNEGRAQEQEMAGRKRFAELLAGGLGPDELGEALTLDPEGTKYIQTHQWDVEAAKTAHEQALADKAAEYEHEDLTHRRDRGETLTDAETKRLQTLEDKAAEVQVNKDTAATLAKTQETSKIAADQRAAAEKQREEGVPDQSSAAGIIAAGKTGQFGDLNDPANKAIYDAALKKATTAPGATTDRSALYKQQDQYVQEQSTVSQLQEAKDLLSQGINWGKIEGPLKTQLGASGFGSDEDKAAAQRTLRYNTIMGGQALLSLAATLKGASSDKDVAIFMDIMNNSSMDPPTKAKAIDDMMAKVNANLELQRGRIQELGGDMPKAQEPPPVDAKAATLQKARDAIAKGADPAVVKKRLVDNGFDPSEL